MAASTGRILKTILVPTVLALVIPLLSYTAYQFVRSSRNEQRVHAIYEQQLTAILFSVNQHCWDQARIWLSEITATLTASADSFDPFVDRRLLKRLVNRSNGIAAIFTQSQGRWQTPIFEAEDTLLGTLLPPRDSCTLRLKAICKSHRPQLSRAIAHAQQGYLHPLSLPWDSAQPGLSLMLFAVAADSTQPDSQVPLAAVLIADSLFAQNVVARKFSEMDGGTFGFALHHRPSQTILYSTAGPLASSFEKVESFWLLPHYDVAIKLQGTTLSQLARANNRRNLLFLILVNVVLLGGVSYLALNLFNQMSLVQQKTDFVATVSHELRTPLALISMHAETLELGRISGEQKRQHYYTIILHEARRLTALVDTILDFFRMESGRKQYRLEPLDVRSVVEETLDTYRFYLQEQGFECSWSPPPHCPLVMADRTALGLALLNLLDNAVKFSADTRAITITLSTRRRQLCLAVQDRGIGIAAREQKKVFEKFYRAQSSLVHTTRGSGLGLSLIKQIMQAHHGAVRLHSTPGEGSCFTLVFSVRTGHVQGSDNGTNSDC
jgi:two-component system phosphate regulon sensor histidine kinase PhoR